MEDCPGRLAPIADALFRRPPVSAADTTRARHDGGAPARLRAVPRPPGRGHRQRLFPAARRQAGRLSENQLVAFRDGRRRYPPMNYLLEYLPDPYLQKMADYFAAQQPAAVRSRWPDVSRRCSSAASAGHRGRRRPRRSRLLQLSRPDLTGMEPASPVCWACAPPISAPSSAPGVMARGRRCAGLHAARRRRSLTESDVTAVAAWLASLPAPAIRRPLPKGTLAMPLACGSEPN